MHLSSHCHQSLPSLQAPCSADAEGPPTFFLEAVRFREPPFWRHKTLRPLEEYRSDSVAVATQPVEGSDEDPDLGAEVDDDENEGGSADEEDEEEEVGTYQHDGRTFEEALMDEIKLIEEFTAGLKHQTQFRDGRLLNALQREGAGFLRFAKACMDKERRMTHWLPILTSHSHLIDDYVFMSLFSPRTSQRLTVVLRN